MAEELEGQIIRQVEYYFSDYNLYRDKFMQKLISEDPEGWVPVEKLMTFKRLNALSSDAQIVLAAVDKSTAALVQISEDRDKIRRHPDRPLHPRTETVRKEIASRGAYVKGFPQTMTMDELIEFFMKHEKVEHIIMRKYPDKEKKEQAFKGSVFVTFETKEQCEAFIKLETVMHNDVPLTRMNQQEYHEMKRESRSKNKQVDDATSKLKEKLKMPRGAILHITGFAETTTREMIRESLPVEGDPLKAISFIEFNRGEKEGYVRMREENAAKEVVKRLAEGKEDSTSTTATINDTEVQVRVLEGEEEDTFLERQFQFIKAHREKQRAKRAPKRKHKSNKRRHDDDDEESTKKTKYTDEVKEGKEEKSEKKDVAEVQA